MREVICIGVGQAGVQLGNASWELFCVEHGIEANGLLKNGIEIEDSESFRTFFQEVPTGQFVPRAISIDLEPTVIDEIRSGSYRHLFHPDQLLSSMEDGASNFARGFFTIGKLQIDQLNNTVRKLVESCNMLQGFFLLHSVTGGTGGGFSTLIVDTLTLEYTKRNKFQTSVFPSPVLTTAIVEPYNCVFSNVRSMEKCDITNIMDNEAIYGICMHSLDVPRPTYSNLNRVICRVFSDLTVSLRFGSSLNNDMDQMCTNLIPYPRIHFPVTCHTPLISYNRAEHDPLTTAQLTKKLFERNSQMVSCPLEDGQYMCCVIQYRGNITPIEVNQSISEMKRKSEIKFVEWCPTGVKLGVNSQPPICIVGSEIAATDKSVTMLANSTSIKEIWEKVLKKFDVLFAKRAFVHWYVGEGMEEGEFTEARDELAMIYADYVELEIDDTEKEEGNNSLKRITEVKEEEKYNEEERPQSIQRYNEEERPQSIQKYYDEERPQSIQKKSIKFEMDEPTVEIKNYPIKEVDDDEDSDDD